MYKTLFTIYLLCTTSTATMCEHMQNQKQKHEQIKELEQFRACGSYCGPGWCNNMWLDEEKCNATVAPEHHKLTGYSCADQCCQKHDICCGQNIDHMKYCNKEIVQCLSKCDPLSLTCTLDLVPVPAGAIEVALDIIEDWCCGKPCAKRYF